MWRLVYDNEWVVSEFEKNLLDPKGDSFIFRAEAEAEALKRNSPRALGWFWSEGDDRE